MAIEETRNFRARLHELSVWATVKASRAGDLSYEWLAAGFGFVGLYLFFVIALKDHIDFLDIAILCGVLVTASASARFENNSRKLLEDLAKVCEKLEMVLTEVDRNRFSSGSSSDKYS